MNNIENWEMMIMTRGDHFRFGSVFINKSNQTEIFFFWKKNRNRTETGSNRPVSVRFFYGKNRFKLVWLGFLGFGSVFSVLAWFYRFWFDFFMAKTGFFSCFLSVSVRFGFFGFLLIKPKPNRTGRFFQKFNRFNRVFFRFGFFGYFFFGFLGLISFLVFLLTPNYDHGLDNFVPPPMAR